MLSRLDLAGMEFCSEAVSFVGSRKPGLQGCPVQPGHCGSERFTLRTSEMKYSPREDSGS